MTGPLTVPRNALVVAGGRGTRLLPLTAHIPKPMLPFCGAPFLAGLARRLGQAGVRRISLVVGADTSPFVPLIGLLAPYGLEVDLVAEPTPLDTAGGVRAATTGLDEPVLVLNGDVLSDLDLGALVAAHRAADAAVTIALTRVEDPSTFGVCVLEGDRITAFIEKPAPGSLPGHDTVNAGAYVLSAGVLDRFAPGPLSFEREVFPTLLAQGETIVGLVHDGVWTDLGTPDRFLDGQRLVLDGALSWPPLDDLVEHPDHPGARCGHGVRLGRDIRIDGPVILGDGVTVGAGAAVGPYVVAAAGAVIERGADVSDALLSEGVVVGARGVVSDSLIATGVALPAGSVCAGRIIGPPEPPPSRPPSHLPTGGDG